MDYIFLLICMSCDFRLDADMDFIRDRLFT